MSDKSFHNFLNAQGAEWRSTVQLSPEQKRKCLAAMDAGRAQGRRLRMWGRRTMVSTMSLAAAIVLVVTVAFPPTGNTPVAAKTVLAKLAEQVEGDGVLSVTLSGVRIEGASIEGQIQIAGNSIAGDLHVSVVEDDLESPIVVDASLGISPEKGWVLIRRLEIPDPQAQALIQLFVSAGTPTLILLPEDIMQDFEELTGDEAPLAEIRRLATGQMAAVVREVVNSGADLGAVTTRQPDGTTRVTLRVKNAETLRKLIETAAAASGQEVDADLDISENDAKELLGCTLAVTYDEQTQSVRSFSISNVAEMKGTITIALHEGQVDSALLDSARVTPPNTRTIDVGFLKSLIESAIKEKE